MSSYDLRDFIRHAAEAAASSPVAPEPEPSRRLSPLAEEIVAAPVKPSYSPVVLAGVVRLAECLLVALTGIAVHWLYLTGRQGYSTAYFVAIPTVAALTVVVFQTLGLYHVGVFRSFVAQSVRLFGGWTVVFLVTLAAFFLAKMGDHFSRVWLVTWFVAGLGALLAGRILLSFATRAMTRAGRLDRRTAIVGGGEAAEELILALTAQPDSGIRILGIFDDRNDERSPDVVAGYPKLGNVDDLVDFARRTHLDLVVFTLPISAENRILQMLRKLWILPIDIRLAAHVSKLRLRPRAYSYIGNVPVLDVFDKPIADWDLVLKWLFDKIVGSLLLILLSPVMIATAIAVKLDSRGPVFFRQKRYGFNNELIEVFKFRSMYVDQSDATAAKLVTKGDPRVTRVGRIIRKTSLDELPQLFNVVFKGNLSLVGPRPHALHAKAENRLYDQVVDGYFARHKVKPGITGWAQINGWRGETDTEEKIQRRVEHDLFYIENWSVLSDLYILAATPFALLKSENAY
ncbi:undecaprenyl-phosphate glucose phosphotransferase [Chelatococcus sp. SYSU_G07232]|uniref:Undecaprenyl-phosphate glucose phosphotransferase n=1 Tax=Chelatococcus albus TaxID=3047466 RepID=A0ABT7AC30_9HYPH|nr:undecaprenyl-phosphate glucose phosphotransferase [Chelatococcus sp. SYSU_G07232]MDJ1156916.1 undecaprenyl-phosphate glucose phosphotransferase [Chelatococcus sp. SYSU_G07232]